MDVSKSLLHPASSLRQRAIRRRVRRTADALILQSGSRPVEGLARQVAEGMGADTAIVLGRMRAAEPQRVHEAWGMPSDSLVGAEISLPGWEPRIYEADELKSALAAAGGGEGSPAERLRKLCERHETVLGHGFRVEPLDPLPQDLPFSRPSHLGSPLAEAGAGGLLIVAWNDRARTPHGAAKWAGPFAELAARAFRTAIAQSERNARQMAGAAIHRIGLGIDAGQPLEAILRDVCRTSVDIFEARGATIRIGRGDRLALETVAGAALPQRWLDSLTPDEILPLSESPGPAGERALLALPLRLDSLLEGTLALHWRRPRVLEPYEWQALERLVDLASQAIHERGLGSVAGVPGLNGSARVPVRQD